MKAFYRSLGLALVLAFVLSACSPDNVGPRRDRSVPTLQADTDPQHPTPDPTCSNTDTFPLIKEGGGFRVDFCGRPCPPLTQPWGLVEVKNGTENIFIYSQLATGWFVDTSRSVFAVSGSLTLDSVGIPQTNSDWDAINIQPDRNKWTMVVPLDNFPDDCVEIGLRLTILRRTFFGGVDPRSFTTVWPWNDNWNVVNSPWNSSSPYVIGWCAGICNCVGVVTSQGGCATLTPDVSGLTAPLTYDWCTGETTASIDVCPATDGNCNEPGDNPDHDFYRVDIVDANGENLTHTFMVEPVNLADVACGNRNDKVYVCHYPPGNPANVQTICISWNGVPAHVAAFRSSSSNPNMGHDSGCQIGECGYQPCDF